MSLGMVFFVFSAYLALLDLWSDVFHCFNKFLSIVTSTVSSDSVCLHTLAPFARMPVAGTLDFLISFHSIWVLSSIFSTLFLLVSCFGNLHRATFMSSDSLAVLSLVIRLRKLSFFIYLYVYFFPPVFPTDSLIVSFCRNSPSARACCIFVRLSIYSFLHLADLYWKHLKPDSLLGAENSAVNMQTSFWLSLSV